MSDRDRVLLEKLQSFINAPRPYLSQKDAETLVAMPKADWTYHSSWADALRKFSFNRKEKQTIARAFYMCEAPFPWARMCSTTRHDLYVDIAFSMDLLEEATRLEDDRKQYHVLNSLGLSGDSDHLFTRVMADHNFKSKEEHTKVLVRLLQEQKLLKQRMMGWEDVILKEGRRSSENAFSKAYISMMIQATALATQIWMQGTDDEKKEATQTLQFLIGPPKSIKIPKSLQVSIDWTLTPYLDSFIRAGEVEQAESIINQIYDVLPGMKRDRLWKNLTNSLVAAATNGFAVPMETVMILQSRHPNSVKSSDCKKIIIALHRQLSEKDLLGLWNLIPENEKPPFLKSMVRETPAVFETMAKSIPNHMIVQALNDFFESKIKHLPTCQSIWERHILMEKTQVETQVEDAVAPPPKRKM